MLHKGAPRSHCVLQEVLHQALPESVRFDSTWSFGYGAINDTNKPRFLRAKDLGYRQHGNWNEG